MKVTSVLSQFQNDPIVRIQEGKLRGVGGKLVDGSQYYSFKGIPYATPPIGNLRFKVNTFLFYNYNKYMHTHTMHIYASMLIISTVVIQS